MSETKTVNMIFTDDDKSRLVISDTFNFALDKETGISACWGKTMNDSPDYDPITPEELIFKIDKNFDLSKYLKMFNFLANIKEKIDKTEFKDIENEIEATTKDNLTCLSTLASVVLIFDKELNNINIDSLLKFTKYIHKFNVAVIIQINTVDELTYTELTKLKLLGTSIQIKTDDNFNAEMFIKNINLMKENDIITSAKINVNKNSYEEVSKLPELLDKDSSLKLHFVLPYVTTAEYVKLQKAFNEADLKNARIATCAHNKFNKRKANIHMLPVDCDASRFSVYIEDEIIYPCEFAKINGCKLSACKSIHDFWYAKDLVKMREYITENNFCNFIGK